MPGDPSVLKSIQAVRKAITAAGKKCWRGFELHSAISDLFRLSEKIVGDIETLGAVLAFAPEIEAYRGKGSQSAANDFSRNVGWLVYEAKERLPQSRITPDFFPQEEELLTSSENTDVLACIEAPAAHAFARTQGPPVRSRHAAGLRSMAWDALWKTADILRRPEHLAHALKVAEDPRASIEERTAAVNFLPEYWGGDDPDDATVALLEKLEKDPPDRDFLVTVLQARIELGLDDEFGAMSAIDDWDDAHEEK